MQAFRHLLCPVDLSEPAAQALGYAAALGTMLGSDLTTLYVRASRNHSSSVRLETFVRRVVGAELPIRLVEREGEAVTEILATAMDVGADLVVMGTHGRTGLQRLLLGSVTERVIRRSPAPVLVVPFGPAKAGEWSSRLVTVACAVDFSEPSGRAVDYAGAIAATAGARLVLVHALEWVEEADPLASGGSPPLPSSEDDAVARINELLREDVRERCSPEIVVGYGTAADEVERVVRECAADLIVLGVRRRNPLDVALFGSTAQRLIRDAVCAVLTVRHGS